jgi:hypothetical protein
MGYESVTKTLDLRGEVFGKLTAIDPIKVGGVRKWVCKCECGRYIKVLTASLRNGNTESCGCIHKEGLVRRNFKHGRSNTTEYGSWTRMNNRCNNHNTKEYKDYGGRGIMICQRWREPDGKGFINFLKDMGECPEGMTLDRIDVNGNYEPNNCRWSTLSVQAFNQRTQHNNTSGKTGVYFASNANLWISRISYRGERIYLGSFKTLEEAVEVRECAELKYFGGD